MNSVPQPIRILVIDDNPAIHEDVRKILSPPTQELQLLDASDATMFGGATPRRPDRKFEVDCASQGQEGLQLLETSLRAGRPYAIAFVDVRMPPGWDGVETIGHLWRACPMLQVVVFTAYSDYAWDQMIEQLGQTDNLLILKKPFDNIEVLQLAHALGEKWQLKQRLAIQLNDLDQLVTRRTQELQSANDQLTREISDRLQIEKALRLSEERFAKAFRASPIPLAMQTFRQQKFVDVNEGFLRLTAYSREDLIGHTPDEIGLWGEVGEGKAILDALFSEMSVHDRACRLRNKLGEFRDILLSVELFELGGEPFILMIAQDITEQSRLEAQLRQAQKMEAVGQLAAGVAHDFNNILTIIQGNASLLLNLSAAESRERRPLEMICQASERAARLVQQLLMFSRRQQTQMRPLDIVANLRALEDLLPRALGELVKVEVQTPASLPLVNADAGMIEQMVMNIAVNARDAMPQGGKLTISAEQSDQGPQIRGGDLELPPGPFIRLSFSDTGCGMTPEVQSRIFEPFFTTKPIGKGTGLGLATAYGIVKQHRGAVEVTSEVGKGSTFHIYLPVARKEAVKAAPPVPVPVVQGGTERILVAEDERDVRDFVVEFLKSYGYQVHAAPTGAQAWESWAQRAGELDLLVTDLVMPGGIMGRELALRLTNQNPQLKVIFTSGYSPGMAGRDITVLEGQNFLPKPFSPTRLLQKVRETLDNPSIPAPVPA